MGHIHELSVVTVQHLPANALACRLARKIEIEAQATDVGPGRKELKTDQPGPE
jgi:hypothetical protein